MTTKKNKKYHRRESWIHPVMMAMVCARTNLEASAIYFDYIENGAWARYALVKGTKIGTTDHNGILLAMLSIRAEYNLNSTPIRTQHNA